MARESDRRTPVQERSRQTVAAILEAAAQVFEERGLAGTTTDRVARRAGVSVGSLYQYFPDKGSLLVALARQHVDRELEEVRAGLVGLGRVLAGSGGSGARDPLRALVAGLLRRHRERPRLTRLILEELPPSPEREALLSRREDDLAAEVEALLLGLGVPPQRGGRLGAWMVVHLVQGLVHHYVQHPPPGVSEDAFLDAVVDLVVGWLLPSAAPTD